MGDNEYDFSDVIPFPKEEAHSTTRPARPKAMPGDAVVTCEGGGYSAWSPVQKGGVELRFTDMVFSRHSIDCVMRIELRIAGETHPPFSQRIDLRSASARKSLATDLNAAYGNKAQGYNWVLILNVAFNKVVEEIQAGQKPLSPSGAAYKPVDFLLYPFLQQNVTNMVFASSLVGKSWFTLRMALSLASGEPFMSYPSAKGKKTLLLDYEDDFSTFTNRLHKLCEGLGVPYEEAARHIYYYKPSGSFRNNVEMVRRMVVDGGFSLCIVDAGGDAAGGSPNDEEKVLDLFNALEEVPCTFLVIHHEPKTVMNEQNAYYGSMYWKGRARVGWRLKHETTEPGGKLIKALLDKNSNIGGMEPFYYWFRHDDEELALLGGGIPKATLERADPRDAEKLRDTGEQKEQEAVVLDLLGSGPMNTKDLAKSGDMPTSSLRRVLETLRKRGAIRPQKEGKNYVWKLAENGID